MTTVFLAIPGTQETRELDLETVRNGVASGEIPLDNWAWSPQRNEWLPLSQLPEFAAAPAPVVPVPAEARVAGPVKVAVAARTASVLTTTPTGDGTRSAGTRYSKPIEEPNEFPIFKVLLFVLSAVIIGLVAVNYCLIEQPLRANMAKTPFAHVEAYAHLGAFMQPNVLLIHIPPSREINSDNFADLLTALTQSAPHEAIPGHPFNTVSLTPGWLGRYALPVDSWSGFADMGGYSAEEKKEYVLSHLELIDGEPLVKPAKNETGAQHQAREDQAWNELVGQFQSS